jgi:hypothetical protein
MQLKVDTGADSNIIPWSLFTAVCSEKDLKPTIAVLRAYNGSKIKMHGTCNLKLSHQAQSHTYTRDCEFFITEDGRTPLLSLQDSTKLGLIKVMCEVQQDLDAISDQEKERKKIEAERRTLNSSTASPATDRVAERYFMDIASKDSDMKASNAFRKKMLHDYSDTFTGTGTLEGVVKLELRDSFEGFRVPIRRVPIALQDPLRQELKELLEQGIIRRIKDEERVDCVNSFVIVRRSNGKIRLCLDPTRLNHSLIRPISNRTSRRWDYEIWKIYDSTKSLHKMNNFASKRIVLTLKRINSTQFLRLFLFLISTLLFINQQPLETLVLKL